MARIVVVEDDDSIREVLAQTLLDEGFEVTTARDGAAALALVAEYQPHVILVDAKMPVVDGPTFITLYRQRPPPHAAIVGIAASPTGLEAMRTAGASATLPKPYDLDELLTLIRNVAGDAN